MFEISNDRDSGIDDKPNIVVITIETTRSDHLPCYGYYRNTTPNICEFAEQNIIFENAYSQASYTLPSMTSMHTSKYPRELETMNMSSSLPKDKLTISEFLNDKGYYTVGVGNAPFVHPDFGLDRGFDRYNYVEVDSEKHIEKALDIKQEIGEPYFMWLHLFDPHGPLDPKEKFKGAYADNSSEAVSSKLTGREYAEKNLSERDIEYLRNRYDEELLSVDESVGNLFDNLKDDGEFEDATIIITADHGKDMMEHGWFGHGTSLHNVNIKVPMTFKSGRNKTGRIKEPVGIIDIFPTIKDIFNEDNSNTKGQSLFETIETEDRGYVISQHFNNTAVIDEKYKYINRPKRSDKDWLFNLYKDPKEKNNLDPNNSEKINELRQRYNFEEN